MRKKSDNKQNKLALIFIRYIIILIIGLSLALISKLLTPLTLYTSAYILKIFYNIIIIKNTILINDFSIEIVEACVATSAYFLLLILNLASPMKSKQRLYSMLFLLIVFFIINIFRILFFSLLVLNFQDIFFYIHFLTWFIFSSIIVFLIWLASLRIFKIKELPVYSDIKYILKLRRKR